jgi:hypothetical protein
MVEPTTSVPQSHATVQETTPVPGGNAAQAAPRPAGEASRPTCRHCRQPLFRDGLWGWMHAGGRYLCQDPATGEPLCQPATPA